MENFTPREKINGRTAIQSQEIESREIQSQEIQSQKIEILEPLRKENARWLHVSRSIGN
jgi:hypothetical protein